MVNRYWKQPRSKLFSVSRFLSAGIQDLSPYKRGEQGKEEGVFFVEEEGRARRDPGAAGKERQPRTPARAGSAAARSPGEVPGEPGMLCPGVLVYSYESITIQDHPHPSNAGWISSHRELQGKGKV